MSENTGNPLGTGVQEGLPGLTPQELEVLKKVFSSPMDIPQEWKAWLVSYLEANPPVLPISQIFGFSAFTVQVAPRILTSETRTSSSYGDLTTPGPSLTEVPKGKYLIVFGCNLQVPPSNNTAFMSISVNGVAADDNDAVSYISATTQSASVPGVYAATKDLTLDSNTIDAKYRATGGALASFAKRWMLALKYGNL